MAEPRDTQARPDPRYTDPVYDDRLHARPSHLDTEPADPALDPLARVNDPVLADRPMATNGRGAWIAAGIVATLLVIAVIAFSSGTATDPGTTAVIPDTMEQTTPAPVTPETAPVAPSNVPPANQ